MCNEAVQKRLWLLESIPDWFLTKEKIKLWCDDYDYCKDDRLDQWHDSYIRQKAQKVQIKKELIPIAWHPSRYWNWCMSEDEKWETENFFLTI